MKNEAKKLRLAEANQVIAAISAHGRRFFYCSQHDRISRFEIDDRGRLWLRDKWTDGRVYLAYRGNWRLFSDGGTLRRLIEKLAIYIRTGEPLMSSLFGPWPDWICDGDLWGYGSEAMASLRTELQKSPAISFPAPRSREASISQLGA